MAVSKKSEGAVCGKSESREIGAIKHKLQKWYWIEEILRWMYGVCGTCGASGYANKKLLPNVSHPAISHTWLTQVGREKDVRRVCTLQHRQQEWQNSVTSVACSTLTAAKSWIYFYCIACILYITIRKQPLSVQLPSLEPFRTHPCCEWRFCRHRILQETSLLCTSYQAAS